MTIKIALEDANEKFNDVHIENYYYETRELLSFVLNKSKEWIMTNIFYELSNGEYEEFNKLVEKRLSGIPFQYIIGYQYFMGNKFLVNKDVLIPRADTEILVYNVFSLIGDRKNISVLDMCTGSGCIAVSLSKKNPTLDIYAVDISSRALKVAGENNKLNETNVKFFKSNLYENIPKINFDIIVSNPPYISTGDMRMLSKEVLNEPHIALDGGDDGLDFYRLILDGAKSFLKDDGYIAFEIGYNQAKDVISILTALDYKNSKVIKDYSGNDRVIISQK